MQHVKAVVVVYQDSVRQQWLALSGDQKLAASACVSVCVGAAALALVKWYRKHGKLPPGPPGVYFTAGDIATEKLTSARSTFGDVSSTRVWTKLIVQLNSTEAIREAFHGQGDIFAGRPKNSYRDKGKPTIGVIFTEGEMWKEHRRFILSSLRDFGFGKNVTEQIVQNEARYTISLFESMKGEPVNPTGIFGRTIANVISALIFGQRCQDDDEFKLITSATKVLLAGNQSWGLIIMFWRLLILLPGDYFNLKRRWDIYQRTLQFVNDKINEHRRTFDGSTPDNLIDAYLVEVQKLKAAGVKNDIFTDEQLSGDILHLFLAGTDTTQTTLCWAVFLMAVYPDIQAKVQADIDEHIGDKLATLSDRARVRYTEAVLHEVERWATIGAIGLPHRLTEDATLKGYSIPAGSIVLANLLGVHRDTSIWPYANTFNPDNFLDNKGNLKNLDSLVPFSLGKRSCLGESLAKQELFIMFVSIMQRFNIAPEAGKPVPSIHVKTSGNFRPPPDCNFVFSPRK